MRMVVHTVLYRSRGPQRMGMSYLDRGLTEECSGQFTPIPYGAVCGGSMRTRVFRMSAPLGGLVSRPLQLLAKVAFLSLFLTSAVYGDETELDAATIRILGVQDCGKVLDSDQKSRIAKAVRKRVVRKYSTDIPLTDEEVVFDCGAYFVYYSFLPPRSGSIRFGGNVHSIVLKPKIVVYTYMQP